MSSVGRHTHVRVIQSRRRAAAADPKMLTNKLSKNYLFVGESAGSTSAFFQVSGWRMTVVLGLIRSSIIQIALKFAERGHSVLFILPQPLESLPVAAKSLTQDLLKKIIFRYIGTFKELMKVLLGIHTWSRKPSLVLINSPEAYFKDCGGSGGSAPTEFADFFANHCLIAAALQNAIGSLSTIHKSTCVSVLSMDFSAKNFAGFYKQMEEKFVDLYFYEAQRVVDEKSVRAIWEEAGGK